MLAQLQLCGLAARPKMQASFSPILAVHDLWELPVLPCTTATIAGTVHAVHSHGYLGPHTASNQGFRLLRIGSVSGHLEAQGGDTARACLDIEA